MAAPCSASRRPDRGAGWALPVLGDFLHDWHLNARRGRRDAAADAELCARPPTRSFLGITAVEPEHPLATHLGETQDLPHNSPPPTPHRLPGRFAFNFQDCSSLSLAHSILLTNPAADEAGTGLGPASGAARAMVHLSPVLR